ncbi:MAG: hypothetical protein U0746_06880 [Gemmataceae bacterium]
MLRIRLSLAALAGLMLLAAPALAQTPPPIAAAHGVVDKATKDTLTIKPRGVDGKFEKAMEFQLTGTSKITVLTQQMRGGKQVAVQNEVDAKDLKANQNIALIYTPGTAGPVVLTAVVLPLKETTGK